MKINEKNLAVFAISTTPTDKEGWLVKRGEINKAYQRRWFVLKGNLLFYFDKRTDKEPIGVIVLEGCTIELAEDEGQYGFKIIFHGQGNRTYVLEADSQECMEQWMKALACASYDYMKLMVLELEKQLKDIEMNVEVKSDTVSTEQSGEAPKPPPRVRHNPFNRPSTPGSPAAPRSTYRSAPPRPDHPPRQRVTFKELHNNFGRPILQDLNEWRHRQRDLQEPLIIL